MRSRLLAGFALVVFIFSGCDSTTAVAPTADVDVDAALATMVNVAQSARLNAAVEQATLNQSIVADDAARVQLEANEETFAALFSADDQERMLEAVEALTEAYPEMLTNTEEENRAFALELITRKPDAAAGAQASMMLDECTNWCDYSTAASMVAIGTAYTVGVAACGPAAPLCAAGAFAVMSTAMAAAAVQNTGCVNGCNR